MNNTLNRGQHQFDVSEHGEMYNDENENKLLENNYLNAMHINQNDDFTNGLKQIDLLSNQLD